MVHLPPVPVCDAMRAKVPLLMATKETGSVVLLASVLLSGCLAPRPSHNSCLYQRIKSAAVEVLVDGRIEGSGWFVNAAGDVITAAHAVSRTNSTLEVLVTTRERLPADVIASDKGHDLALLRVRGGNTHHPFLRVADQFPAAGESVYLYGIPVFQHGVMLGGIVARDDTTFTYYSDRQMLVRCYHITAPSPPGTSGGPWVDARGHVVGNQSGFLTDKGVGAGVALVSPPDAIRRLITTRTSVPTATLGCGLEELWTQSPGFIRRFPKGAEGVVTVPMDKGGPAETAGLTKESLIVAIQGRAVRYKDDVYGMVHVKKPGDLIRVTVLDPDQTTARDVQIKLGQLD